MTDLEGFECVLIRYGGKHDGSRNPTTGISQPVPRHREINEIIAKRILKQPAN
ncbi:MAG: addiction module toxin, HicA family [Alkalispirochaeta sp.]